MRYCNLKFGYNKASVKCTAFQNCIGMKKLTLANKTTPKLLEHKMCLTICIVTKPHLGKMCIFLPILFIGKMIHYICTRLGMMSSRVRKAPTSELDRRNFKNAEGRHSQTFLEE